MADLADVMDAIEAIARGAVYPAGTGSPSVTGRPVDVAQGWPLSDDLDAAMRGRRTLVSVYAVPGTLSATDQPFGAAPTPIEAPARGVTAALDARTLTIGGTPRAGEVVVLGLDGIPYTHLVAAGDTPSGIAAALAAQIPPARVIRSGAVLDFPVVDGNDLSVGVGGPVRVADRLRRQNVQIRVVVWAPTPAARTAAARAVDVAIERDPKIRLADGSLAHLVYAGTNLDDTHERTGVYRRDLMVGALFDTIEFRDDHAIVLVVPDLRPVPSVP